jgi:hypothetical protein
MHRSTMRRRWAAMAAAGVALLSAGAAQAAVSYEFRWYASDDPDAELWGAFQFTTSDFIDAKIDLTPAALSSCVVNLAMSSCGTQTLDPDSAPYDSSGLARADDAYDVVVFRYDQATPSRLKPIIHYFDDGAFQTAGVYQQQKSDYISVLTVSVIPDTTPGGVPEPSTWALMIAGFGLAGSAVRRRRPVLAS